MADANDEACQLNRQSTAVYKLPNSLIDVCLIYGVDEKTSGRLTLLDPSSGEVCMFILEIVSITISVIALRK